MGERQLGTRVYAGRDYLTMEHLCTLKNLQGVLLLTKEEPRGILGNVDAEQMVEGPHIGHVKLRLESRDKVV